MVGIFLIKNNNNKINNTFIVEQTVWSVEVLDKKKSPKHKSFVRCNRIFSFVINNLFIFIYSTIFTATRHCKTRTSPSKSTSGLL